MVIIFSFPSFYIYLKENFLTICIFINIWNHPQVIFPAIYLSGYIETPLCEPIFARGVTLTLTFYPSCDQAVNPFLRSFTKPQMIFGFVCENARCPFSPRWFGNFMERKKSIWHYYTRLPWWFCCAKEKMVISFFENITFLTIICCVFYIQFN